MSDWNPLYPSDDDVNALEEAAREAEWEDDTRRTLKKQRRERDFMDDDDEDFAAS